MATTTHKSKDWVQFNPLTQTYITGDKTNVAVELVDTAQCMADVFYIASIREEQRARRSAEKKGGV
jgi:hypothetical protein